MEFKRYFQKKLDFGNVGFCGGKKNGASDENPWSKGREPTTDLTHK